MRKIYLTIAVATIFWQCFYQSQAKSVTKRATCSGGGCNTCAGGNCDVVPEPCSGGGCAPEPAPCSGGGCNSCSSGGCAPEPRPCEEETCGSCSGGGCNRPRPEPRPRPKPARTCSSCGSSCSNVCRNSGQCFNSCVRSCGCDPESIEQESSEEETTNKCCEVLHPKTCFTEENGNKRCVVRRHRECSDLCSSSVVSIQEGSRHARKAGCQYIRNYPYAYCGNYERHDCGQCYTCDGSYNPRRCSRKAECGESCRSTISY